MVLMSMAIVTGVTGCGISESTTGSNTGSLDLSYFLNNTTVESSVDDVVVDETPSISPNIKIKAIVGEKYTLPEPTLVGLNSLSNNPNILKTVYNADGEEIALVDNGFKVIEYLDIDFDEFVLTIYNPQAKKNAWISKINRKI